MLRNRVRALYAALPLLVASAPPAVAQIPDEFHNLKVLPEDISQRQLVGIMRGFAMGLGVRCEHCHLGEPGQPLSTFDFESDEKETKRKARLMLQMVQYLNDERLPQIREASTTSEFDVRVTCQTCHHGLSVPRTLGTELAHVIETEGTDASISRYRSLRDEFYGSGSYDFGEQTLVELAGRMLRPPTSNPDAALAIVELQLEFFPESVQSWVTLGGVQQARGDLDAALTAVRKALELDPDNQFVQRMLTEMEGN